MTSDAVQRGPSFDSQRVGLARLDAMLAPPL